MTENKNGEVLELLLSQAASQVAGELGAGLAAAPAANSPPHRSRAMAPLARQGPGHALRRASAWAACIVAAMLVGSAGAALSVEAVRESIINFIFDPDAPETEFTYAGNGVNYTGELVTLSYMPRYFVCTEDRAEPNCGFEFISFDTSAYSGDDCLWFNFTLDSDVEKLYLDTENGTIEETKINGYDAEYIKNPDYSILLWYIDDNPCIIAGNISKNDMFKIASGVELI